MAVNVTVWLIALLALLATTCLARPPNFVVFLADDLGYGDVGCYGHPTILTPNIDALARGGMKMTQFYSTYPICTPSRSGLLTGRLPVRNGIFTHHKYPLDNIYRVFLPISEGGLPSDEVTIPQMLKQANYASALYGKWHLGHVSSLPTQRGFDQFYGLPYSQDEGCPPYPCHNWQKIWPGVPLYNGTNITEQPVNLSTITPRYNEAALNFIDTNKDRPFFLMMAYDEVHVPLFASNKYRNTSTRGLFGDAMSEMDDSIGLIVQKLSDSDLLENTLIVFTSDNGAWLDQKLDGGTNGLLRGQKGETWEGGMRVPTIFYWPGHIQSATVSLALGSHLDLLATFANLSGTQLPNKTLDSYSLTSVLLNNTQSPRETIFYYRATTLMAVRYRDYKAHFVTRKGFEWEPPEEHDPPLLFHLGQDPGELEHDPPLLFHLGQDPGELYPLDAAQYSDVIKQIQTIVEDHTHSVGTLPPSQIDPTDYSGKIAPCCDHASNCTCVPHERVAMEMIGGRSGRLETSWSGNL